MVTVNQSEARPGPGLPVADLWVRMQRGEAHAWGEWFRRHDAWVTRVLRWELWGFDAHEPERVAEEFRLALMRFSFAEMPATSFPRKVHELLYGVCREACSAEDVPNYQVFSHAFPIGDSSDGRPTGVAGLWARWEQASSVTVWTTYVLVLVLAGLLLAAVFTVFGNGPTQDTTESEASHDASAWDLALEGLNPAIRVRENQAWASMLHDGETWLHLNPSLDTNVTVQVRFRSPDASDTRWHVHLVVAQRDNGASMESDLLFDTLTEWEAARQERFKELLQRLPGAAQAK